MSADGKQGVINLTKSGYQNEKAKWSADGKSMFWSSDRNGLHSTDTNGDTQADIYQMFFTQDAFDRSKLSKTDYEILKTKEDAEKKKKEGQEKKPPQEITPKKIEPVPLDLEHLEDRTRRVTLGPSLLEQATFTGDGETLIYVTKSSKGYEVWSLKVREKELKRLQEIEAPKPPPHSPHFETMLEVDREGKTVFVLAEGKITKIKLDDSKAEAAKLNAEKIIDGYAERAYLFEHIWRQIGEKFYAKDMGGVDWNYYKTVYARFLPYISNGPDFAEMVSEMLGELNASHTGCRYYYPDLPANDSTAALGAFFDPAYKGAGLRIQEVIDRGPLITAAAPVRAGMIIEEINGAPLNSDTDISPLLNHLAGQPTLLSIFDPAKNTRFEISVKPITLDDQNALLYRRWVKRNRDLVDKLSNGTIGYVHVRAMDDASFRDTYSEVLGRESGKKALIVDTRYNGGGNLHEELVTFLSGKRYLQYSPRGQDLGWEPLEKWNKKSVVLISECNYSDAHLFPWSYQHLGIGKLIGMPVPGTGTFVWWETEQDPTFVSGIPQGAIRDEQGRLMEKAQVEPDIRVANDPKKIAAGEDQQLEKAVEVLMKE